MIVEAFVIVAGAAILSATVLDKKEEGAAGPDSEPKTAPKPSFPY